MRYVFILLIVLVSCTVSIGQDAVIAPGIQKEKLVSKPGLRISQFVTTDINRNRLSFSMIARTDENFGLGASFGKFISDQNKQISIYGNVRTAGFISDIESPLDNFWLADLGASVKLFQRNKFLEFEFDNSGNSTGRRSGFNTRSHTLGLNGGIGRIDFVNDASIAKRVVKRLAKLAISQRDLTDEEFGQLVQKIAEIKNERRFENRSYSMTGPMQIALLLQDLGIVGDDTNQVAELIHETFKYEPMVDRTTGSQFKAGFFGRLTKFNANGDDTETGFSFGSKLNWEKHNYINDQLQWNYGATVSAEFVNFKRFDDFKRRGLGSLQFDNRLHYLINHRSRLSLTNSFGISVGEYFTDASLEETELQNSFFLNNKLEYEFMTSRRTAVTLGAYLNFDKYGGSSGLSFGFRF